MSDQAPLPELDGLMLPELIDLLVEPTEPPPIPMWPQTGGWLVLAAIVLAGLALLGWRRWQAWQRNAYRRAALRELPGLHRAEDQARLLRRTALAAFPRRDVAPLTGEDWRRFLNRHAPGAGFASDEGRVFLNAAYQQRPSDGADLVARWIRQHRREEQP